MCVPVCNCVYVHLRACAHARVRARARVWVCVRACACVCARVRDLGARGSTLPHIKGRVLIAFISTLLSSRSILNLRSVLNPKSAFIRLIPAPPPHTHTQKHLECHFTQIVKILANFKILGRRQLILKNLYKHANVGPIMRCLCYKTYKIDIRLNNHWPFPYCTFFFNEFHWDYGTY